ncbi:MarR family transcriptional regulator [Nonomuraea glycinis]|uniref:MarR family transcriptional regulator n=1 Tax=Nonomuraea glycinis TaxID=2047744 RepID=A0A918ACE3_9ACTN|nr:MarR family transcriptional regulator [Nonomuraea glycinis]MCA2181619.1 MarR family transcriptional regulator [Nonomuraea glycinis]WSG64955.1 MarR family transcriptional regulator [Nonomuraea glycinis]GGP15057.1 MarR family transcriptional regulator [Nonomuraea glycinis]
MTETRWLDATEMAAWRAFVSTTHLLERRIEEQLKSAAGLTHPQYEVLVWLAEAPGRQMRMSELARVVVASKSALTYQITQLEKAGLVQRTTCPSDERGVLAVITEAGLECLRRVAPGHVDVVRAYLIDQLTREELESMTTAMRKTEQALRR